MSFTTKVLLENAKDYKEKNEIRSIEPTSKIKLDNIMVSNLYKSALDKSHVDFEDIPVSRGDIETYKGYETMMSSIDTLTSISKANNVQIPELDVLKTAISNIKAYRKLYSTGFSLKKDFIMMQYNCLVMACVQTTTCLIVSYVDFIKRIDTIEFTVIKSRTDCVAMSIQILEQFNNSVKSGENQKLLSTLLKDKEGFMGAESLIIGATVAGLALSVVPILRELIFYFYYTRMKASEYLELQVMMLELNKQSIENSNSNPKQKREILKRQEKTMNKMLKLSEKLKVSHKLASNKVADTKKSEEKNWTLDNLKKEAIKVDTNFTLL